MARRKGSGRGKSTVNSRKSALENAREKLKDDPGGTQRQQSLSKMEAATAATTPTATTTTTKHYNKTKLQNNQRRGVGAATATSATSSSGSIATATATATTTSKKHSNNNSNTNLQTTYRAASAAGDAAAYVGGRGQLLKPTAKQARAAAVAAAKAAAERAAVAAALHSNNSSNSDANDPLAIRSAAAKSTAANKKEKVEQKTANTKVTTATATGSSKNNISNHASGSSSTTTTTTTTPPNNNKKNSDSSNSLSKISINDSSNNNNNNNNKNNINKNDNNIKHTTSSNNSDSNLVAPKPGTKAATTVAKIIESNATADNVAAVVSGVSGVTGAAEVAATTAATASSWNNSRYLHKKFKRLASTTEVDGNVADAPSSSSSPRNTDGNDTHSTHPKIRTASLSSASSISPPPAIVAAALTSDAVSATLDHSNVGKRVEQSAMTALTNGLTELQQEPAQQHVAATPTTQIISANPNDNYLACAQQQQLLVKPQAVVVNAISNMSPAHAATNSSNCSATLNSGNGKYTLSANINNSSHVPRTCSSSNFDVAASNAMPGAATAAGSIKQVQVRNHSPLGLASNSWSSQQQQQQQLAATAVEQSSNAANAGRHVCPYCNLNCTKPSVLQKHIRAHTNERPYPCKICNIAFKTKSNYYKHCRSRSHDARKRGIELPADAADGLFGGSDLDGDPELSNSSSEVISRTASPLDEPSICSPQQPPQSLQRALLQQQQQQPSPLVASPTQSPSSLSAAKSTYLQQQPQQPPLGSPAAGTLPPTTAAIAGNGGNTAVIAVGAIQKQSIDYKPYKPKFHNAALYASTKEAASKQQQQLQQQQQQQQIQQHVEQQQHKLAHLSSTHSQSHPTLSPSTQVKLNNHISTHQLQLQMQQQQQQHQQHQQQHHHHHQQLVLAPGANALPIPPPTPSMAAAAGVFYLSQPPPPPGSAAAATIAMLHPTAHIPQQYYSPAMAAAAHQQALAMLTPQQQFHHQLQLQQQHLQQLQQHQQQQHSPVSPLVKNFTTHHQRNTHTAAAPAIPAATMSPPQAQPTALHYLANAATAVVGGGSGSTAAANSTGSAGLLHGNISSVATVASSGGSVHLNKEFLEEHISKLISQNEAIVENKELLLQKKYPKTLNRSRSFNNANNSGNISGNSGSNNSSTAAATLSGSASNNAAGSSNNNNATGSGNILVNSNAVASESANAKLLHAIVQKQQQQQQQQKQQHHQQQQQQQHHQQQQQQQQHHQQQQQQHFHQQQQQLSQHLALQHVQRLDEAAQSQPPHLPPNGISKHLNALKPQALAPPVAVVSAAPAAPTGAPLQQQPCRQQLSHMPHSLQMQAQHMLKELTPMSAAQAVPAASGNVPLNLSAKSKGHDDSHAAHMLGLGVSISVSAAPPLIISPSTSRVSTPRKRSSIDLQASANSNEASGGNPTKQHAQPNNSIIKNLLLNARGLAVPTGEGDDAVYICPLCSLEFRTPDDLKRHNSTYCQGASSSAPISPVASPSAKYFRSNSISLNFPELKNSIFLSRNPLSLAKLAWSQLKTKPSTLVLSQLSASTAGSSSKTTSMTTTTSARSTATPSYSMSHSVSASASSSCFGTEHSSLHLVGAPLPSPGPLLGKTPLVDAYNHHSDSRRQSSEDVVVITKMHEDRSYTEHVPPHKRNKYESGGGRPDHHFTFAPVPPSSGLLATAPKRLVGNSVSGGDMQHIHDATGGLASDHLGLSKKEERLKRFTSSGGCMIPISECQDIEQSPKMIRTPLLSGGSFQEVSPKPKEKEHKTALTLSGGAPSQMATKLGMPALNLPVANGAHHFQFPPINSITAFNPLTLPPMSSMSTSGEKIIPYVPGIPGPNNLTPQLPPPQHLQLPIQARSVATRALSPNRKKTPSPMVPARELSPKALAASIGIADVKLLSPFGSVQQVPSEFNRMPPAAAARTARNWMPATAQAPKSAAASAVLQLEVPKKSFNFLRIADNLSPRKGSGSSNTAAIGQVPVANAPKTSPPEHSEVRHFNFEHIVKEPDVGLGASRVSPAIAALTPLHVDTSAAALAASAQNTPSTAAEGDPSEAKKSKFLRPTSLPLKPGTFTPKRHHGITPNANTLPLISPETPRPSKSCVQLYLNGHAYTYLGLKCSTKMFYCTVNCPQPSYVAGMHKLSMYSVWQVCAENNPHPLGFNPKEVMSLYDSRQKSLAYTMAGLHKLRYTLVVSQQLVMTPFTNNQGQYYHHQLKQIGASTATTSFADALRCDDSLAGRKDASMSSTSSTATAASSSSAAAAAAAAAAQLLVGGYESHEDYTYIRGRGRGRYVCSECGIRCKKPSMLKKHIRTHTDVRPYTCKHCNFSFKTKGNLTKHMQSKTHFKKCIELGINPGPMPADGEFLESDVEYDQQSMTSAGGRTSSIPGESDSGDDSSDNETESSDADESKSRLQEHEAARCLLSLSMTPPMMQSVSPQLKSDIYGYQQNSNADNLINAALATQAAAAAAASSGGGGTVMQPNKRVVSFTSPKPPFDYQKQEQYYSNPEESKPKRNASSAATSFESVPIDLTKPRPSNEASAMVQRASVSAATSTYEVPAPATIPGPLQTQAQIRDVIFGTGKNESGFLKTLISVSDKVRTCAESEENHKKSDENTLLNAYLTEQALQYWKIKQSQMNRTFPVSMPSSGAAPNSQSLLSSSGSPSTMTLAGSGFAAVTTSTMSSSSSMWPTSTAALLSTGSSGCEIANTATFATKIPLESCVDVVDGKSVPKVDNVISTTSSIQLPSVVSAIAAMPPCKSSDEGEESECQSDQENAAVATASNAATTTAATTATATTTKCTANSTSAAGKAEAHVGTTDSHNANLPAAVQQPGTTDFSGVLTAPARTVIVGEDGFKKSTSNEIQPVYPRVPLSNDGRPVCTICSKSFQKQHQLVLHMNIHYMERKFKCEACGVSFRTQGHLQKHERSEAHKNKVIMTSTFGVPTTSNPRPFECTDCKIAFRIHGHLAKHLRSKTHVQKLECLQKLPFGTYAEIERAGISLTEIDTSDCDNSLISLKLLAQKLIEKDPTKLGSYVSPSGMAAVADGNSNAGIGSQDSASEDGFSAAASAAASAIASLDNDSAANTPQRANSLSEDETIAIGLNSNLKRRLPGSFSTGEESDNPLESGEKRARTDLSMPAAAAVAVVADAGSPASSTTSSASTSN